MGRQKLIHLHSATAVTPFQLVDVIEHGEIAVAYNAAAPKLIIKDSESKLVEFIDSVAINNIVTGITGDITALKGRVGTLETSVSGLTDDLADEVARAKAAEQKNATAITANAEAIAAEVTRATSAETANATAISNEVTRATSAETALGERIDGVDTAYKAADTALGNRIKVFETNGAHDVAALETRVGANEDAIELLNDADTVEGSVAHAVKVEADRAKAAEKENADAITAETSSRQSADEALGVRIDNVITAYTAADATVLADAKSYTDGKVSSVYRYKGSVAKYADLPTTGLTVGDVYNVVAAYGTHPAGTNFAWTGSEWDALGGPVDLSTYALKTEVQAVASDLADEVARATSAETDNATAISNEVTRATSAETALGARLNVIEGADTVNGSIKKALKDAKAYTDVEQSRAEGAEQTLDGKIDNEVTRATSAETALGARIDGIVAGMTTVGAANAAITVDHTSGSNVYNVGVVVDSDAFLKIDSAKGLQVVGVAKATDLTDVANRVDALETSVSGLTDDLEEEVARAKAAEQKNATAITANAEAIAAEVTRATSAETALGVRITNEVNRATSAETANANAISGEVTRATAAEDKKIDNVVVSNLTGVTATSAIADHVRTTTIDFTNMTINCGTF